MTGGLIVVIYLIIVAVLRLTWSVYLLSLTPGLLKQRKRLSAVLCIFSLGVFLVAVALWR